ANRKGDHGDLLCRDLLVSEFLIKWNVRIAVYGGDDRRLFTRGAELADGSDARLPIGVTERRVVDGNVFRLNAFRVEVSFQDLICGTRIDIVRAFEHPPLYADLLHEVVDRRDSLLIRRSAGIDYIARRFLALVLNRVEEKPVVLLKDGQHRFAGNRSPATKDDGDLVPFQQLRSFFGEQGPIGRRVYHHGLEFFAQ